MGANNIVCCSFNKAYSILTSSKNGSLKDNELYSAALFSYQASLYANHVGTEYSCLSESDFDKFSQKLQSCCGCCGVDSEVDTTVTPKVEVCPICFNVVGFTDDPQNDGIYVDPDSDIVVVRDNGVFQPFFQVEGSDSVAGSTNGDFNWRSSTYISNTNSDYYGMFAVAITEFPANASKIQIWDASLNPTPQFVTEFDFNNTYLSETIFGPIAYDSVNDRVYFTTNLSRELYYLNLSNGTYVKVMNLGSWTPTGDVSGYGIAINPITNKRYIYQSGNAIYPPRRGAIAILSPTDVVENIFPFDTIYTTTEPNIENDFASTAGFVFDNDGYAYTVTAINATNYLPGSTQRDILKLDPITNEVVGIINYDPTLNWIPISGNATNQTVMQYYDGTGKLSGEKLLVAYRNYGTLAVQTLTGNTFSNGIGSITRLVAFDTQAPYSSTVLLEMPDSTYGRIWKFFYSYQFNKIFAFGAYNNIWAFDVSGNEVYYENTLPYTTGYIFEIYDLPSSNRVFTLGAEPNPTDNMYVLEPPAFCENGRIYVENQGTYTFDNPNWISIVQSQSFASAGNQWSVSATFIDSVTLAKLEYTTNFTSWSDLSSVDGGTYHTPSEWLSGLTYVINSEDGVWFRLAVIGPDDCIVYGQIYPTPPPMVDFEGDQLTIYKYDSVNFTDLSVGIPTAWSWTFDGGTPSTSSNENPTIQYDTPGTYDVSLTASNTYGSGTATKTNYITVNDGYIINSIPGSSIAYSLRKLDINYTGPAIKIRRDSDDVELDIFFIGQDLDTDSISNFCGSANGFVVTWYDQSGNANDATQATLAQQPKIYNAGSLLVENGKPCIEFDGSDDNMLWINPIVTAPLSGSIVGSIGTTGLRPLIGTSALNQITLGGSFGFVVSANSAYDTYPFTYTTAQGLATFYKNGLGSPNTLKSAYRNGVQLTIGTSLLTNQIGTYNGIAGLSGSNRFAGKVQEIIIWDSYKASKNSIIQNDVNSYFNIY